MIKLYTNVYFHVSSCNPINGTDLCKEILSGVKRRFVKPDLTFLY